MAQNPHISQPVPSGPSEPSAPGHNDLPPPYSAVVGNQPYGFVMPPQSAETHVGQPMPQGGPYGFPKTFTAPGVYPHPEGQIPAPPGVSVGVVIPPAVGSEPTTITCFNCNKLVTTRVTYTTAWHTHLVAGSVCIVTMFCSLCCLGLIPYCFDSFKDAEHYCPNCNTFIGKCNKC